MNRQLLRRLERLEVVVGKDDEPMAIVHTVIDGEGEPLPVLGWVEMMTRDPLRIMRRPGEPDDELKARAIEEARARRRDPRSVPCLLAIVE